MAEPLGEVRVDAWVSSVRFYKTRSLASAACRGGHVSVNGKRAKPASPLHIGDRVEALTPGGQRIAVVTRLVEKRVGAAVAVLCFEDLTPPSPPTEERPAAVGVRDRGAGRPTKRERRQLDRFQRGT